MRRTLITLLAAVLLTACGQTPMATSRRSGNGPRPIACLTSYRSSDTKPLQKGPALVFAKNNQTETAAFAELVFRGDHFNDEFEGRSLAVSVKERGRPHPLVSQLYQMNQDAAPPNSFGSPGQGFTDLIYVNSARGAELQFICESR